MTSRTLGERFGVVLAVLFLISVNGRAQDISTVGGKGLYGFSGDGGPATGAALDMVYALACDSQGNIYIADSWNNRVRKTTPAGVITTIAGTGESGFAGDGGPATSAKLECPRGIAVDSRGTVYISDSGNSRIRKIAGGGIITTIAGTETAGFGGDGGPATAAQLSYPRGLAVDSQGNLYLADSLNFRIRRITAQGIISTVAGMGACGPWGDGGPATEATIGLVQSLALDWGGNLYFTDACFNSVRRVSVSGTISTVARNACVGEICGKGGAPDPRFLFPRGLAIDPQGRIFIGDSGNHQVRVIGIDGTITSLAGTGIPGFSGDGGPAATARLNSPYPLALHPSGNLMIGDSANYRLRQVTLPAVAEHRLMFPFYLKDPFCATAFAVLNESSSTANVRKTLYGADGLPLATSYNSSTTPLEGNRQLARMGEELFGVCGNSDRGWVNLLSDRPVAGFFQFLSTSQIDGGTAFTTTHRKLYFTRIIQGGGTSTYLSLANPSALPAQVELSLAGASGSDLAPDLVRTIPGHGVLQGSVAELFGQVTVTDANVIAEVKEGDGIIGFELIRFPDAAVGLNAQPVSAQTTLYSAQYAEGPEVSTNLRLINTTGTIRRLTFRAIDEQGQAAAGPVTVSLGPNQSLERSRVADLFPGFGAAGLVASLKVDIDAPGVIGDVLFGHPQLKYASALPLQDAPLTKAVLSHVACGMGYFTGLGLYNAGTAGATITVKVYKATGALTGTHQLTLGAGCRIARLLDEAGLVPASAGQVGGYVTVESTQPLIIQQLFGLSNLSMMSAVPPLAY